MKVKKELVKVLMWIPIGIMAFDIINIIFKYKFGMCVEINNNTTNLIKCYVISALCGILIEGLDYLLKKVETSKIAKYKKILISVVISLIVIICFTQLIETKIEELGVGMLILIIEILAMVLAKGIYLTMIFNSNKKDIKKINNKLKEKRVQK